MKKLSLFMFAAAAAFMSSSCSSDEPVPNQGTTTETGKYITVNIVTNSTGTRAETKDPNPDNTASEEGYSTGSSTENGLVESKIDGALFMFFDKNGAFSQQVYRDLSAADGSPVTTGTNQNVEYISKSTLVLQQSEITPTQLMVIINPTDDFKDKSYGMTLTQVRAEAENFTNKGISSTSFVMSNSVYKDANSNEVCDIVNITDKSSDKKETAEANPVEVYVERVNGKVTVDLKTGEEFKVGGTEIELHNADYAVGISESVTVSPIILTPKILGYSLVNIPKKSNLVKDIKNINYTNWTWNKPTDFRSFWANNWASTGSDIRCNFRYKDVLAANKNGQSLITTFYPQENTSAPDFSGKTNGYYNTQLLVLAQLCDDNGQPVSFVKYRNEYYSEDTYYQIALNLLKKNNQTLPNGSDITKDYLKIHRVKDSNGTYHSWQVKISLNYATAGAWGKEKVEACEALLNTMDVALFWQNGKCYYFTTIQHFGKDANNAILNGIVRNHWYNVELTGVYGLGTPVFENDPDNHYDPEDSEDPNDPDNPDDPYNPEDEDDNEHTETPDESYSFLYARVNILSWKIVGNKVVLGY
jgi:hypothetical protein